MARFSLMLPTLLASAALILALVATGLSVWNTVATKRARSATPGELLARMTELEAEWASTLEANTRFLKRLAQREARAAKSVTESPTSDDLAPGDQKGRLRMIARQKGLGA